MKFVVSSSTLLSHLQIVGRVIGSKNTLPILNNLLFRLEGNELEITASDLETRLSTKITLENVSGSGAITIPNKILIDTLKEFSEQPLSFEVEEGTMRISITSENGQFNIVGQSAEEFPSITQMGQDEAVSIDLSSELLLNGISKTLFATSDDEMRPTLAGIYFDLREANKITFAATDSHKMVRYQRTDVAPHAEGSFILAKKPAQLLKLLLAKETDVKLQFDSKVAQFIMGNFTLICRLVEGAYPNYNAAIPQDNPNSMVIDRMDIYSSTRRVSNFSNAATNLVQLTIGGNQCEISAQDADFAVSGREKLPCEYTGENIEIGFKSNFLLEILSNLSSQHVTLTMSSPSRAGLFLPHEQENPHEEVIMLLMPISLS